LSRIGLVAAQGSLIQPSVCAEFWGLLSIFPRVSRKQLPEYQQLLKHHGLLLGTGVQLVVSCTTIEAQFALLWEAMTELEVEAFPCFWE